MHRLPLTLLALLLTAAAPPDPPLCRVTASYRPLSWASSLRALSVRLAPDCPADGTARIQLGGYGGPGSTATGPTETLTHTRPQIVWVAQPSYRTVLWLARSGRPYEVDLRKE
jgi:hypothetical protein